MICRRGLQHAVQQPPCSINIRLFGRQPAVHQFRCGKAGGCADRAGFRFILSPACAEIQKGCAQNVPFFEASVPEQVAGVQVSMDIPCLMHLPQRLQNAAERLQRHWKRRHRISALKDISRFPVPERRVFRVIQSCRRIQQLAQKKALPAGQFIHQQKAGFGPEPYGTVRQCDGPRRDHSSGRYDTACFPVDLLPEFQLPHGLFFQCAVYLFRILPCRAVRHRPAIAPDTAMGKQFLEDDRQPVFLLLHTIDQRAPARTDARTDRDKRSIVQMQTRAFRQRLTGIK